MNETHLRLCASPEWARVVAELLPSVLAGGDLGDHVIEVGPGPGLTTDVLLGMAPAVTAVELDPVLARQLAVRLRGTGVSVVRGDAAALPLADGTFSAASAFTMLHHVPTPASQDRILAELHRVLRPGGILFGTDGLDTPERRALHEDDVFVPVVPAALPGRLEGAGFTAWRVETNGDRVVFAATRN
jgi:SAM-dependent methyltransferase